MVRVCGQVLLLVDVDFMVSAGLHEKLAGGAAAEALLEDLTIHRQVVVLPAFETDPALGTEAGAETAALAINSEHPPAVAAAKMLCTWFCA